MTTKKSPLVQFPDKLAFLFRPCRYKVARGGRGGSKSWGFARALLILGAEYKLRILCAREVQKSIRESVHKLLSDQIQLMGFGTKYDVYDQVIRGRNGTEIIFTGLSDQTSDSIKSYEGIDICWVEEAHTVRERSWRILIPTIRKGVSEGDYPGCAEIWVSFNPELETDYTYKYFVTNPPPECLSVEINWRDNPWFPKVLEKERQHCKATDPDNYDHIWEGKCKPAVEGAIFYKEIAAALAEGRIYPFPIDPILKTHIVADIGWHGMALSLVQRNRNSIMIHEYIEGDQQTWAYYSGILKDKRYNWGRFWLPHDGYSRDPKTGVGSDRVLRKLGWDVPERDEITELSIEEGIKQCRLRFSQMYFNEPLTRGIVECAKRYRRRINRETETPGNPLHDDWSHGADNLRYISCNVDKFTNEDNRFPIRLVNDYSKPLDSGVGY